MRIGIDLSPLEHSRARGIGVYARSLLGGLAKAGPQHQYVLFAPAGLDLDFDLPPRHIVARVPHLPLGRASALVNGQLVVPWLARRKTVDVLHSVDIPYNPSHPAPPALYTRRLVVTLHDLTPLYSPMVQGTRRYRAFYRFVLRTVGRAKAIVVDSRASGDDALRLSVGSESKMFVVPLAASPLGGAPSADFEPPPTPYVLNVGSDDWNKNRDGVLAAFARLEEVPGLNMALVGGGEGWRDALPERLHARVRHYTGLSGGALESLYRGAAVFVFPSRYEGFGLPILEAMLAGVPVVTSDRGAMQEVAGDAALCVDPDSPEAIAGAVRQVLGDEALARRLREAGVERASRFSWEETARATLRVYEYAARKGGRLS